MPTQRQIAARRESLRTASAILALQLCFTFVLIWGFYVTDLKSILGIGEEFTDALKYLLFGVSILCYLSILYCDCEHSCNILCLAGLTLGLTYFTICNLHSNGFEPPDLFRGGTATFVLCAILFFLAVHLPVDLTRYHTFFMVLAFIAIFSYFALTFIEHLIFPNWDSYMKTFIIYGSVLFFLFDAQTIIGEKFLVIGNLDVIYASARFYFDIMWMFLLVGLSIVNKKNFLPK